MASRYDGDDDGGSAVGRKRKRIGTDTKINMMMSIYTHTRKNACNRAHFTQLALCFPLTIPPNIYHFHFHCLQNHSWLSLSAPSLSVIHAALIRSHVKWPNQCHFHYRPKWSRFIALTPTVTRISLPVSFTRMYNYLTLHRIE